MHIRSVILASSVFLISNCSYAWQTSDNSVGEFSTFDISQKTDVPGKTLQPGKYTIHVMDQLADRMIVSVDKSPGKEHATFIGVPHRGSSDEANTPGPLKWKTGIHGATALRGFQFEGGSTVEFVYPKADAVDLAKLNAAKVVAVDPESEGKPVLKDMSQDDLRLIHLWMLSLTTVTPTDKTPAILAQKYQNEAPQPAKTLTRNNGAESVGHSTAVASLERPAVQQRPQAIADQTTKQEHLLAKLPHTASQLPLVAICGLLSFLLAGGFRIVRALPNRSRK